MTDLHTYVLVRVSHYQSIIPRNYMWRLTTNVAFIFEVSSQSVVVFMIMIWMSSYHPLSQILLSLMEINDFHKQLMETIDGKRLPLERVCKLCDIESCEDDFFFLYVYVLSITKYVRSTWLYLKYYRTHFNSRTIDNAKSLHIFNKIY